MLTPKEVAVLALKNQVPTPAHLVGFPERYDLVIDRLADSILALLIGDAVKRCLTQGFVSAQAHFDTEAAEYAAANPPP